MFTYDEESPSCLRWKVEVRSGAYQQTVNVAVGDPAGTLDSGRYDVGLDGTKVEASHIVWKLHFGAIPDGCVVDHLDGDSLNNRINNLRIVTAVLNARNRRKYNTNTSGVTGVYKQHRSGYTYWVADWREHKSGVRKLRNFSVLKHGDALAFELAVAHRAAMIASQNADGAGYTERHGQ